MTPKSLAICLMVGQGIAFSVETALVHHIGSRTAIAYLAFFRSLASLAMALMLSLNIGWQVIKSKQWPLQIFRGLVLTGYLWVMMFAFSHLPLADATSLSFTRVAYIAIFSMIVLHEHVTLLRWAAAMISICGAFLVTQPSFENLNLSYLFVFAGVSLNALGFVLAKLVQRPDGGDSVQTTMIYAGLVSIIVNAPMAAIAAFPEPEVWPWLAGILILGPVGGYLGNIAVQHADTSVLGPYTLSQLVVSVVGGVIVFHEVPNNLSLLGSAVVLLGCLLAAGRLPNRRKVRI